MKSFLISLAVFLVLGSILSVVGFKKIKEKSREEANKAALQLKRADITVTIVEGKRREEIATLLDSKGVCTYEDFMQASTQVEGKLFPDTYRFFPGTAASVVVASLTSQFSQKTSANPPSSKDLVLASIVEREAANDSEREVIAGVYQNRLTIGMRLEADPTVQYGKETKAYSISNNPKEFEFWKPITRDDYQAVISQFNTYRVEGLPSTPICNPGLKSILAAQNPTPHSYYFFLHKNGKLLLSKTLTEHQSKQ